ncbi:patatin-like phospholipase family protein [Bosea sp. PAMC 26642]|uniref:patatin-like phospholipase family protein n=1 Tax=Bosea sp. (strain PAMC 26642) TaxID=1792307 RepID=UPI00076FE1FF|nr:patatin-like phospholipase family protein [Bosea sp. PAMC 26642]AMJ60426.1 NTE family protein rssA [Bosea sp. PAMC 26642]
MNDMSTREPLRHDRRPKIGLALGGGAARGWAHIGVLEVLLEAGFAPDVIAGTSIGAVVGGCYCAGKLPQLAEFAGSLTKRRVVGLMDFHIGGAGLIAGGRLKRLLQRDLADLRIESLDQRFVAISTELGTGHEIWLTHGLLVDALSASYALPGVFDPVKLGGRWLMDGALVNPVPVTAARALGADVVICVNLNGELAGRGTIIQNHPAEREPELVPELDVRPTSRWLGGITGAARRVRGLVGRQGNERPGLAGVMIDAFNITQDRISRSRLAGDPPDVMIGPKLARIGLFDFHRAEEAMEIGRNATRRSLDEIEAAISGSTIATG